MAAVVTAGAVVAILQDGTPAYFYCGAELHDGVPAAEVQRLVDLGLVRINKEAFVPVFPEQVVTQDVQAPSSSRPKRVASKEEWATYAAAQGMDPAEAASATKDDLITRFGG